MSRRCATRSSAGSDVVYPAQLPDGWCATRVTVSPGSPSELELSMLTPDSQYVGFVESPEPVSQLLGTYVDKDAHEGPTITISGSVADRWDTWTRQIGGTPRSWSGPVRRAGTALDRRSGRPYPGRCSARVRPSRRPYD
ncbi:MAG: DUF4245 family protein [Nocardioides sp.]